jgi:hypothetical protein
MYRKEIESGPLSKVIEEEVTRRLHGDLKG